MTTESDPPGLVAGEVSFAYGSTEVIRNVTFGVRPGDSVALCGPNGSGKTTLLRLLAGDLRPSRGQVLLDGRPLTAVQPVRRARHIAVIPQHVDPQLGFIVNTLVGMGRSPYTGTLGLLSDDDHRAVDTALRETDCIGLATRRFNELSGGEQQRVSVAMALAQETPYLLLDEPTVHLDLRHQFQLLELLRQLQRTRRLGLVAALHDLNLAALYFARLAVMQDGCIVADGPSADIVTSRETLDVFQAPLTVVHHPDAGIPQVLLRPNSVS